MLETFFAQSPTISASGLSTPVSPSSTNVQQSELLGPDGGAITTTTHTTTDRGSSSHGSLPPPNPPAAWQDGPISPASLRSSRRIFLPSRPSSSSIYTMGSERAPSFMSFSGSIMSRYPGHDADLVSKSTASLPQLSRDVESRPSPLRTSSGPSDDNGSWRWSRLRLGRTRSGAIVKSSKMSAEDHLRRHQRSATMGSGRVSPSDAKSERSTWSSFIPGLPFTTSRVSRQSSPLKTTLEEEQQPLNQNTHNSSSSDHQRSESLTVTLTPDQKDQEAMEEFAQKMRLLDTPDDTPAGGHPSPLVMSPEIHPANYMAKTSSQGLGPSAMPACPDGLPAQKRTRAFEDNQQQFAPVDPKLLALEMKSTLTQKGVCSVCKTKGVNFPSCGK